MTSRSGRDLQRYDGRARLVVCAVPLSADGARVLLISSSKHADQWILPKGGWDADESAEACAARELAEEAGVHGDILGELGAVDYETAKGKPCRLHGFGMRVTREFDAWSEAASRRREWVSLATAKARLVRRPELATMLERAIALAWALEH
ncbi:hypothetical protein SPRG_16582 [Saprolegnia parasitica CBS 223.65]|uniref:Nudix hydrolase domain-containing protein n=1 Tax=Saprolegnia parasitica (strain CBS 223.65) TaxID=695850 RepID=A0A067BIQ3_SAPPC|nr:hypothetical protein SPRG_16582 [Saprolegnia parasitica CBS 223.65]KDO18058.1 hypothetical protein SPRG_16582 [Saprolegnia parasitica CBS 223.65]|eukprot:XP_012211238.1 hypothetical protein SPRG_16582 [Saprolegnia parasitica CBS 223.65]